MNLMHLSSISRPSAEVQKKKKNNRQPRSTGKAKETQQLKKNKKQQLSLKNDQIEELTSWMFSTQEAAQVETTEIGPQVGIFRKGALHKAHA